MLSSGLLLRRLRTWTPGARVWVAFSGGRDSTVLLHLAAQARAEADSGDWSLQAVHVNHGLHPQARQWEAHCEEICTGLDVPLKVFRPSLRADEGNLEARARSARYGVFRSLLQGGDVLLMAHHLDDQAESMLLALMRGRGPGAVAGIPAWRRLGRGRLWRPLLDVPPRALDEWARRHQLHWIEDPSNSSSDHDRNYLRHQVLPGIRDRWPGFADSWQRSAGLMAEAAQAQRREAHADLIALSGDHAQRLPVTALLLLDAARRRNVIRHWLRALCRLADEAPPDAQLLARVDAELLQAAEDAQPRLSWPGSRLTLQRFRGSVQVRMAIADPPHVLTPEAGRSLFMGEDIGILNLLPVPPGMPGMATDSVADLRVRFPTPGLSARPAGRRTQSLKKLFQEYAVPPWLRSAVPLLYAGDELVAVGDLFICEGWQTRAQPGYRICWIRSELHCGY